MRNLVFASMLGLATLNGCATTGYGYHHHSYGHHHGGGGGFALLTGILVGAAIAESMHDEPSAPDDVPAPVYATPPSYGPPPPPLPARESAPSENAGGRALDPILAHNALNAVDLSACGKGEAAPIGYGHAKVTFNPDGTTQTIIVDAPSGLSDATVACIGAKLGEARVPEFRGRATTAGFTFRIR